MIIKLIFALVVVLGLMYLVFKISGNRLNKINEGKYIKVLEKVQISKDTSIVVVKIGKKGYIMSSSNNNTEKIDEISEEEILLLEEEKRIEKEKINQQYEVAIKGLKSKVMLIALALIFTFDKSVSAEPINIPNVNISVGGESTSPQNYVDNIKLLIILTILTLLPSIIIMMTSFTRIIVVFSFLKSAMGAQQSIPNQVLVGLALFLTFFIMSPVVGEMNEKAIIFNYIHNATGI